MTTDINVALSRGVLERLYFGLLDETELGVPKKISRAVAPEIMLLGAFEPARNAANQIFLPYVPYTLADLEKNGWSHAQIAGLLGHFLNENPSVQTFGPRGNQKFPYAQWVSQKNNLPANTRILMDIFQRKAGQTTT